MLRTDPAYADEGRARSRRSPATSPSIWRRSASSRRPTPSGLTRGVSLRLLAAARPARASRNRETCSPACGFVVKEMSRRRICAAARPAPTTSCSRTSPRRLRDRKIGNIEKTAPDVIAAGNIGCITQIASGTAIPVVHAVELIDWATGGPVPDAIAGTFQFRTNRRDDDHGEEAQGKEEGRRTRTRTQKRAAPARRKKTAARKPARKAKAKTRRRQSQRRSAARRRPSCRRAARRAGASRPMTQPGPAVTPLAPRPSPFPSSVPGDFPPQSPDGKN